uniref:hypothetical protein n=1 Tax=Stenotrophomonas maltophilia TaxID=40324 RepID=UPI0013DC19D2
RASIEAEAQVYAAIQDLAVFLSSQIGRYTVASDGLFRFVAPAAVDKYHQLARQIDTAANGARQAYAAIQAFEEARARTGAR